LIGIIISFGLYLFYQKQPTKTQSPEAIDLTVIQKHVEQALNSKGYFVTFSAPDKSNYYAQIINLNGVIRVEAVGDKYLDFEHHLQQNQINILHEIGFSDPDDSGNYYFEISNPDINQLSTVATRIQDILIKVYNLSEIIITTGRI
jgi:hypothetical protein